MAKISKQPQNVKAVTNNNEKRNVDDDDYNNNVLHDSPYDITIQMTIGNRGSHPTRGLLVQKCEGCLLLKLCIASTPAACIPCWRSLLCDSIIVSIDKIKVETVEDIARMIKMNTNKSIQVGLIPQMKLQSLPSENFPIQFPTIAYQHLAAKRNTELWMDSLNAPDFYTDFISTATHHKNKKLTLPERNNFSRKTGICGKFQNTNN